MSIGNEEGQTLAEGIPSLLDLALDLGGQEADKGAGGSEARDLIEYLRTMITPPDENLPPTPEGEPSKAVFLHVEDPEAFDWSAYADQSVHAMVANGPSALRRTACGEGDDEVGAWISEAYRVLKPGAHLLLIAPEDEVTGHTGACVAEDLGFEVRDAILLLTEDSVGKFHYTAKSGRSEREAGLFDSEFDYGQQDETRKEGNPGGDNPRNRGLTKRKNVHPCLHPDALVLTITGFRPIRDIRIGDSVYGANGRFNVVEHVSHHPYTSPDLFEIHVAGTNYTTLASDNHPFLIWRPTRKGKSVTGGNVLWVPAEEVQPGDYTMTPIDAPIIHSMDLDLPGPLVEHEDVTFTLRLVQQVVRVPYTGDVWNLSVATSPTFQTAVGMSHNTVKPVEIMEFCLRDVPKDVGPVLDPFLGSGTTLLACIETGHDGIGIEREEEYARIADARIRHRDYETAGWNRAEFISPFSKGDEAEAPAASPPKEISLDDFFGVGD